MMPRPAWTAPKKLVDDSKAAYDALNTSPQGDRLRAAWKEAQAAQNDLNRMARGGASPVEAALDQLDAASAQAGLAGANLSAVQNGARSQQISAAQAQFDSASAQFEAAQARVTAAQSQAEAAAAQVDVAQAALSAIDVQLGKLTIFAPAGGVIMALIAQPGEFAAPGSVVLVLGRIGDKTITVYIPEDRYGLLSIGQNAQVSADSFPGQVFQGSVVYISDQAEFTPRNVQTVQGRKNTVFAVKLKLTDPENRLKAGMPADVIFK